MCGDLKKAFDSVPICNNLTKLYNMSIHSNTLTFITNLYITSKAHTNHHCYRSTDFPIYPVRQGCPLSPILFNLFINDICDLYGIDCNGLKYCGSLFGDDIVHPAPLQDGFGISPSKNLYLDSKEWNVLWYS